ncbi:MAG: ATP-dependent DNA helicase UvrD2, partial [Acidimicrobiales bacterium]
VTGGLAGEVTGGLAGEVTGGLAGEVTGGLAGDMTSDEVDHRPVWSLAPSFEFSGERLAHAMFANAVDARGARPRWYLAELAVALGASPGGPADVLLADGTPAWCDGGPLQWHGPDEGPPGAEAAVVPRVSLLAGSLVPLGANDNGAALAPDQLAAVVHPGGAARIIAPAGSGKTRVLTERARHLLRRWRLPGRAMTLVAFNKRAADEMKQRTADLPELQVRTLNALGLSILNASGAVSTVEENEARSLIDSLVHLPHRANTDPAAAWLEAFSAVRLGLRDPAQVEAEFEGDVDGLPEVFERYRRALASRGAVDFDEQIYRAIEVLVTEPAARRAARASCRVLLVDEFQDLTPAHLLLVRLLAGPDGAVYGVGDDDQTIYGYSGASPEWLIGFRRYFPTAGEHPLEVNYRCPAPVVAAAGNLLSHNRRRVKKRILAAPGRPVGQELVVTSGDDPLGSTVAAVADLLAGGAAPKDVAVLTRVNSSLAPVQVALVHRGVPVRPAVDSTYLSRGGVQAVLAWLRLAVAPAGRLSGADITLAARRPSRALSPKVVEWMSEQATLRELERLARRLSPRDADKVLSFSGDLEMLRQSAPMATTASLLKAVRDDIGLDQAMELLEASRRRLDRSAQTDDLDALVALAALHPAPAGFETWLRQSLRQPGSAVGVVLSSIHRVKGREWPHVVLHEVTAGLVPHRLADDVEEERRVFHVGLTRGSASVHVVAGEPPSPFLDELTEEVAEGGPQEASVQRGQAGRQGEPRRRAREAGAGKPGRGQEAQAGKRGQRARQVRSRRQGRQAGHAHPPELVERARRDLRAWRSRRAAADGKPAYVFLHDRTLEELAAQLPQSMAELAMVEGIGPAKLEHYGDELLDILAQVGGAAPGA